MLPRWRKSKKAAAQQHHGKFLHNFRPRIPSEGFLGMADYVVFGGRDPSSCACRTGRGGPWSSMCVGCGAGEERTRLGSFPRPTVQFLRLQLQMRIGRG